MAHAMLSLPATKGFETGSGFEGTKQRGSAHNDQFVPVSDEKDGGADGVQQAEQLLELVVVVVVPGAGCLLACGGGSGSLCTAHEG